MKNDNGSVSYTHLDVYKRQVDRAAHVKGAHAANGQAQDDGAGGREALEEVHHGSVDGLSLIHI